MRKKIFIITFSIILIVLLTYVHSEYGFNGNTIDNIVYDFNIFKDNHIANYSITNLYCSGNDDEKACQKIFKNPNGFENLEKVEFDNYHDKNGEPLKVVPKLNKSVTSLEINSDTEINIINLEGLSNLRGLSIDASISNIQNLDSLFSLEYLDLSSNEINNIENLDSLVNLEYLNLSSNQIENIENLDSLTSLETLSLSENKINTVENLDSLTSLEYLDLSSNQIENIENLDSLTSLETLSLSGNKINTVENLDSLTNLRCLYLNNNEIEVISEFDSLNNLEALNLAYNDIETVSSIDSLNNLEALNLSNNNISNFEGLDGLQNLIFLDLSNNNIEAIKDFNIGGQVDNFYTKSTPDFIDIEKKTCSEMEVMGERAIYYELLNPVYECGEEVNSLKEVDLTGNPIKYITQESLDYINKNKLNIKIDNQNGNSISSFTTSESFLGIGYGELEFNEVWYEQAGLEVI